MGQRLHWDYRASARLLMQYLDNHMLPGYAAVEAGQVTGYVFCVYEETKAVIGDVFALPGARRIAPNGAVQPGPRHRRKLLRHLFELLLNSPHVDRIESQLLLHPSGHSTPMPFALPDSRSSAGFSWCSPCTGNGARRMRICPATWSCARGAKPIWLRPRGSSAKPIAAIPTA